MGISDREYTEKQIAKTIAKVNAAMRELERTANILRSTQDRLESAELWGQEVSKDRARIAERCNVLWGRLPDNIKKELLAEPDHLRDASKMVPGPEVKES